MLKISPAFAKNSEPIAQMFRNILPDPAVIFEIGSGPGQHAAFFAQEIPQLQRWYPSERAVNMPYIEQTRQAHAVQDIVMPAQQVDLLKEYWWEDVVVEEPLTAIISINVAHIVVWAGTVSLLEGASHLLEPGGLVYFYGPWRYDSKPLEPSNAAFDLLMQERVPGGGLRVFETLLSVAHRFGFELKADLEMPSNNRSIWLVKV